MAFVDVLKFRGPDNALVWKWEPEGMGWGRRKEELRMGTQLVVNPSFLAVFVNGGQIADIFAPGTYTLSTKNLPILDRLVSLPLGGESPFKAEVYYINKSVIMDTKFMVSSFNMTDPNFKVPIPLKCSGSFAVRVGEAKLFLTKILGSLDVLTPDRMKEYFRGVITEKIKSAIGKVAHDKKMIPMDLETMGSEIAETIIPIIESTLDKYGIHLELFNIENISVIYNDPRVSKVVEEYHRIMTDDLAERLRLKRRGESINVFGIERAFDTTEAAANNIGKGGGSDSGITGTIIGMGMAQPIANAVGNVVQGALGQIPVGQYPSQPQHLTQSLSSDKIMKIISDLDALRKAGALTDEEFATKKQELLSKL